LIFTLKGLGGTHVSWENAVLKFVGQHVESKMNAVRIGAGE
jgi:hypothetical protein